LYKEVVYGLSINTKIGDLERRNGSYFALFCRIRLLTESFGTHYEKLVD